jgi:hypothetical protein
MGGVGGGMGALLGSPPGVGQEARACACAMRMQAMLSSPVSTLTSPICPPAGGEGTEGGEGASAAVRGAQAADASESLEENLLFSHNLHALELNLAILEQAGEALPHKVRPRAAAPPHLTSPSHLASPPRQTALQASTAHNSQPALVSPIDSPLGSPKPASISTRRKRSGASTPAGASAPAPCRRIAE